MNKITVAVTGAEVIEYYRRELAKLDGSSLYADETEKARLKFIIDHIAPAAVFTLEPNDPFVRALSK